jgi:hypothetical protein
MIGRAVIAYWKDVHALHGLRFVIVGGRCCCSRNLHRMDWHVLQLVFGVSAWVVDVRRRVVVILLVVDVVGIGVEVGAAMRSSGGMRFWILVGLRVSWLWRVFHLAWTKSENVEWEGCWRVVVASGLARVER